MGRTHVNYALEANPIGRGGQAEVFRARDKRTNELVALKRIRQDLRSDKDAIARMRREIEVQTKLMHPNIMPVLEHSEHFTWYTMPIAQLTVGELIPPLDYSVLFQIIENSVQGLLCAHEARYFHRDITPRNILKLISNDNSERWVISDWGLVRRQGQTSVVRTEPGSPFGTFGYAAPEIWSDAHNVDERADVYSIGRVVAWCLTGERPLQNIPLLPKGPFYEFVLKTTKLNPSERLRTMQEVLAATIKLKNKFV